MNKNILFFDFRKYDENFFFEIENYFKYILAYVGVENKYSLN